MSIIIARADARRLPLADGSVHCCVTSPPYWGLRDYGVDGQLGLETRPDCAGWATGDPCGECYVCGVVDVFREVRRVLRDDGSCFLNLGDSFASSTKGSGGAGNSTLGLKPKDLVMIPHRVALALQADGWWVRSAIVWAKGVSFCKTYSGSCMPESVTDRPTSGYEMVFLLTNAARYFYDADAVREVHSPATTDTTQRRRMIAGGKFSAETEFYGERRVGECLRCAGIGASGSLQDGHCAGCGGSGVVPDKRKGGTGERMLRLNPAGRNLRNVWTISPRGYAGAHFAVFPEALVEPCILAGTSAKGCCSACGAQWVRVVEKGESSWAARKAAGHSSDRGGNSKIQRQHGGTNDFDNSAGGFGTPSTTTTTGWRPACTCDAGEPVPPIVLDPFAGSGTVGRVAVQHRRRAVLFDINAEYLAEQATKRTSNVQVELGVGA